MRTPPDPSENDHVRELFYRGSSELFGAWGCLIVGGRDHMDACSDASGSRARTSPGTLSW